MVAYKRKDEIIDVSMSIIAEKGIQGLTIKNLANSIGISEPAIYRHYAGKHEILEALLTKISIGDNKSSASPIAQQDDIISLLSSFFKDKVKTFEANPALASVVFAEDLFKNDIELSAIFNKIMQENEQAIQNIIRKGQEKKQIRRDVDPESLSVLLLGAFRLTVKKWTNNPAPTKLQSIWKKHFLTVEKLINT